MKPACETCGFIHTANDARAVGRFGPDPKYVAANAPTPLRETRQQAEADECAWRIEESQRRATSAEVTKPPVRQVAPVEPRPDPAPFPAVTMETAARDKAWLDFLSQVRLSLLVWEVDSDVRSGCENVLSWVDRCRADLMFGRAS